MFLRDQMDEFVALAESLKPGIAGSFVPATDDEIAKLAGYAGPLPVSYVRFLKTMGASTGRLSIRQAMFDIDCVVGTYIQMKWLRRDPRYVLIAADNSLSARYYFLARAITSPTGDNQIVRMHVEEDAFRESATVGEASLEDLLYHETYYSLRLPELPYKRQYFQSRAHPEAASMEALLTVAAGVGFRQIAPRLHCALLEREDASIVLHRNAGASPYRFVLGATTQERLEEISQALERLSGLEPFPRIYPVE